MQGHIAGVGKNKDTKMPEQVDNVTFSSSKPSHDYDLDEDDVLLQPAVTKHSKV